jgi:tetratricopeptide (TPR) repeat protein
MESLLGIVTDAPGAGGVVEICAIGGMAGIGKTALAVHAAHQVADRFPDGQIFLQLHGHTPGQQPVAPADALASLLQALGIPAHHIPDSIEPRAWLWRDRLAGKRMVLVLDDAAGHDQVRPLIPGSPGTLVLITSRNHLTALEDARVINLDVFLPEDAAALLVRLAGRHGLNAHDGAVREIARLCGHLPLAIGMLARQLRHHAAWTADQLAAELAATRDRLGLMQTDNLSVAAAFDLSYRDMASDAQRLFRCLGLHPGTDFDAYAAAALSGNELADTRQQIMMLYDNYLLSEPARGRYRMHDLISEYARGLASTEPVGWQEAAIERLLGYYLHVTRVAGRQFARRTPVNSLVISCDQPGSLPYFEVPGDAAAWMDAEHVNLKAATLYAASHGLVEYVIELPSAMHGYLRHHGNLPQVLTLHETALDAARQAGSARAEANVLIDIADIYYLLCDYPAALRKAASAATLHSRHEDWLGMAHAQAILGYVQHLSGEHEAGIATLADALEIYSSLGDKLGQAGTLAYRSRVHLALGRYLAAEADLNQALEVYKGFGGIVEAGLLYFLGVAQETSGDYNAAIASISSSLEFQRDVGNPYGQMQALFYLALAQRESGELEAAAASLEGAMRLSRSLDTPPGAHALLPLNNLKHSTPGAAKSATRLSHAVQIYAALGLRYEEAGARNALGELALSSGDSEEACTQYKCALALATEIGSHLEEARALEGLGRCLLRKDRIEEARAQLGQALEVYERAGSTKAEEVSYLLLDLSRRE